MRATRPSRPSSTAANTIAATASSIRPSVERRMAVSPAQIASSVMKLGTSIRTGIGRNRRRRNSGYRGSICIITGTYSNGRPAPPLRRLDPHDWLIAAVGSPLIAQPEIGQNGLAGDCGLAFRHQRACSLGQKDVKARAETDQPEAFACADGLPFPHERHDAPRHKTGDLDHADAPVRGRDDQRVALIVLARLVELRIDEGAGPICDAIDPPRDWTPIHMAVEHAHEDRDAEQRPVA